KSGGPGSGLYRSTDGGKTWIKLKNGLPKEELGRIAIAVAPSRPSTVYAVVESKKSALYRSDNLGESWTRLDSSTTTVSRPFYFSLLLVDPQDHNRVYKPGYNLSVSSDGGKTFAVRGGFHPDTHAFWVNPANPYHLILGTDGGIYTSSDRGSTWLFLNNLPVSQFYHVSFDMEKPYSVYGGLQDNGSWYGPSQNPGGITNADWKNCGFGDGFWVFVDPQETDIVYSESQGGNITRLHRSTGERKDIQPYPGEAEGKYRFNWNTPIHVTKNALYVGAQFLFRSTDKGDSWERISNDLTTNDPQKQRQEESGGITVDNTTAENHCTIYSICESPLDKNIIWVGTDDGNVQVTWDGGKNWSNVVKNIPNLPVHTWCSSVQASHHDRSTAYATFDGHRTGDMNVYVYRTDDLGTTWRSIATQDIKGYAHVIKEDLVKPDLLFLGTEFGLFISIDGGEQWAQFTGNFPPVPVMDIAIHQRDNDVILATHGRGIYIIDDITYLRKITKEVIASDVFMFDSPTAIIKPQVGFQRFSGSDEFVGSNPNEVARVIYYMQKRHVFGDLKVEIYDSKGTLLKTLPGGKRRGMNIVNWYMRQKPPKVAPAPTLAGGALFGPIVPEGTYPAKLIKGKEIYTTEIKVMYDPDSPHIADDRALQQKTVWKLYRMQERLAYIGDAITSTRDQAKENAKKLNKGDGFAKTLSAFADKLDQLNKTLVATKTGAGITGEQQLREKVVDLYASVNSYTGKPTESQLVRMNALEKEIDQKNAEFESIISKDLSSVNKKLEGKKLEPIKIMTKQEWDKKQEES
ncbi:MAG TPA: glycosyl hydrolase, partial [bacterium]